MEISLSVLREAILSLPPKPNYYSSVTNWRVALHPKVSLSCENLAVEKTVAIETLDFVFDFDLDEWKLVIHA